MLLLSGGVPELIGHFVAMVEHIDVPQLNSDGIAGVEVGAGLVEVPFEEVSLSDTRVSQQNHVLSGEGVVGYHSYYSQSRTITFKQCRVLDC